MKKKEIAKESNKIARAKISPPPASIWEERITALIIAKNKDNDSDFRVHHIPVIELTGEKKLSNEQRKQIISSVRNLGKTTIELKTKKGNGILVLPIFSVIGVDDNGAILAQLNKALKEYFFNLHNGEFTLLALPEFRQLTSVYSQILYRYLLSWRAKGVVTVNIDELYSVLGVPPSHRKNFQAFRRRVLEQAQKEISEKTSLFFTWDGKTQGSRKITAIEFNFSKKRNLTVTDEIIELQRESNQCWESNYLGGGSCKPDMRKKMCRYCTERGRMATKSRV